MALENNPAAPQGEAVSVAITAQYVKDFSFENPNVPQIFSALQTSPEISMNVNIATRGVGPNAYEVLLSMKIDAKIQGKAAFISELVYGGIFTLPEMPEEQLRLFLLVEGPRLLFPFARNIMVSAVRDGGFPYVMINPIDFYSLYLANKDKIGAMQTAGAA